MSLLALYRDQLPMPARGEDRARDFYRKLPGLTEQAKPANVANRGGCSIDLRPVKLHSSVDASFLAAGKARPAFIAKDVRALQSKLQRACCRIVEDKHLESYDRFCVYDPFGKSHRTDAASDGVKESPVPCL